MPDEVKVNPMTLEKVHHELLCHDEIMGVRLGNLEKHLDKKIAAIHRNIHSGDKVAKLLENLVDDLNTCLRGSIFVCPECGADELYTSQEIVNNGSPICPCNDSEMTLEVTPEDVLTRSSFQESEAMVLRIKSIKASKEDQKKNKLKFKKINATEADVACTEVYHRDELLGYFFADKKREPKARWVFIGCAVHVESFNMQTKKQLTDKLKEMVKLDEQ